MISVPEGQINEISRPETSDELQFIARATQKWSDLLPQQTSQIHYVSDGESSFQVAVNQHIFTYVLFLKTNIKKRD